MCYVCDTKWVDVIYISGVLCKLYILCICCDVYMHCVYVPMCILGCSACFSCLYDIVFVVIMLHALCVTHTYKCVRQLEHMYMFKCVACIMLEVGCAGKCDVHVCNVWCRQEHFVPGV